MRQNESSDLGSALAQLSDSAGGYSDNLERLNKAVDDLQESTERLGEKQKTASASLADAAEKLGSKTGQPTAVIQSSGHSAVADD